MSEVVGKTFDAPMLMRLLRFVKPYLNVFYATATFAILIAFLTPLRPL